MKSPLPVSCSNKRITLVPVLPSVSLSCIHSLQDCRITVAPRSAPGFRSKQVNLPYSVFLTPIFAPQWVHLIIKSGHILLPGGISLAFVQTAISMSRHPQTGQQTGRCFLLSPLPCVSFFFRVPYTSLCLFWYREYMSPPRFHLLHQLRQPRCNRSCDHTGIHVSHFQCKAGIPQIISIHNA